MKPKPIPPFELGPSDENDLSAYIKVVKSWNDYGCDSLPPSKPLDRIEHRLFKLFFFDITAALPRVSPYNCNVDDLNRKAKYVVHFLLRLSENGEQLEDLGAEECKQPKGSDALQQMDDVVNGTSQKQLPAPVPGPPTLPPELVAYILQFLDAPASQHTAYLARCALVNRTWREVTLSLMWKTLRLCSPLSGFRFLSGLFQNSYAPNAIRFQGWHGTFVVKLKLSCTDRQNIWRALVQNLFLFPNLQRLTLDELPSLIELSLLFDQHLPSLTHLGITQGFRRGRAGGRVGNRSSDSDTSVDRQRARAFFSRLPSLKCTKMVERDQPIFLDVAHENLRQIWIPDGIPDSVAAQFFNRCSDALSVVQMLQQQISRSTLEALATKGTGLRALVIREAQEMPVGEFKNFMRLRGPQLIALQLCDDESACFGSLDFRSLEYLGLTFFITSPTRQLTEHNLLDLLRKCGRMLRYLAIRMHLDDHLEMEEGSYFRITETLLLESIADTCPNLRGLECVNVADRDVKVTTAMTRMKEEAVVRLLKECAYLKTLDLDQFLEMSAISDPQLAAKYRSLKGAIGGKGYFRWKSYSSSSLHNVSNPQLEVS